MNDLRVARIKKDLKQIDVANYIGISQARYSKIENNKCNPTLEQSKLLIKLLKINMGYFLGKKHE